MKRIVDSESGVAGATIGQRTALPISSDSGVSASTASTAFITPVSPAALADADFSATVIAWQRQNGRHQLPWQNTRDAYRIWLSEIMLQQTQVAAVIPYYQRFLLRFPDVEVLAAAPIDDVMAHWSGLGYYSRARNLHRCAQRIAIEYQGKFPDDPALLAELPGIGRSTAAAIAAFAYGRRAAILDGNVKRVFCRVFGVEGYPGQRLVEQTLWQRAEALLPAPDSRDAELDVEAGSTAKAGPAQGHAVQESRRQFGIQSRMQWRMQSYTQGLMDLGATLCTRGKPGCGSCPLAVRCVALATGRVAQLPTRKPKKRVPERHTGMLIVIDKDQVLLLQRPDSGIWGGLLSLPEFASAEFDAEPDSKKSDSPVSAEVREDQAGGKSAMPEAARRLLAPFGAPAAWRMLPGFSHTFTHFKLHIMPCQVSLAQRHASVAQSQHVWLPLQQVGDAALPAPVKKLLLKLKNEE